MSCQKQPQQVQMEEKDEDEDEEEHYVCPISNSAAAHMLDQCLTWLEDQPEADSYNISTLKGLRALAVRKRGQSLRQKTLTDMFGHKNSRCMYSKLPQ